MINHNQLIEQLERSVALYAVNGNERFFEQVQQAKRALTELIEAQQATIEVQQRKIQQLEQQQDQLRLF